MKNAFFGFLFLMLLIVAVSNIAIRYSQDPRNEHHVSESNSTDTVSNEQNTYPQPQNIQSVSAVEEAPQPKVVYILIDEQTMRRGCCCGRVITQQNMNDSPLQNSTRITEARNRHNINLAMEGMK
jgi:hypothetical protein